MHHTPKASFLPTKKQIQILKNTAVRWGRTLFEGNPTNVGRIVELINAGYGNLRDNAKLDKPPRIYIVHSPIAFFIAQAVIRGVLTKKLAHELLLDYGIDPDLILKPLRRDTLAKIINIKTTRRWYGAETSAVNRLWATTFAPILGALMRHIVGRPDEMDELDWRINSRYSAKDLHKHIDFSDVPQLGSLGFKSEKIAAGPAVGRDLNRINEWTQHYSLLNNEIHSSVGRRWPAHAGYDDIGNFSRVVGSTHAILPPHVYYSGPAFDVCTSRVGLIEPSNFGFNGVDTIVDAEAAAHLFGIKTIAHTWIFELMHEAAAVMTFSRSALVLVGRPTLRKNADNELHSDTGPAVEWEDGASIYAINGHMLSWGGQLAVQAPEKITTHDVRIQTNEETRRIFIERMGWDKYLTEAGAVVIDKRENWVDNTIELLIEFDRVVITPNRDGTTTTSALGKDRRLVLACRSTGRKYFITVPDFISTCEAGQNWLANGAHNSDVAVFSRVPHIIGAS